MLPRSGASAILEGGNVAHLSQSRSPSVSTLSSKPAACRPQRKKKHGSAALHLRDDGLRITGRAIRKESGQLAWLPPGHAARHARQLQRPQSGRWARRRARETCRGRSVHASTSYIGAHPAPSILAHLTLALAFRPLRMEQPLGSLHEFVRELERAPHYRYSSIHCIETLSHPLKARLRDHDKPERSRSQTRRPTGEHASLHHPRTPSLGNACRRQLGSVARHPASDPPAGTRRAANTPLVLEPSPRVGYGKRRRARSHALVPQYGQSTLMSCAAFWSTGAGPSLPSQRIAQAGTPLAGGTRCRTPLQHAPLLEEQELHRRASHAARSPTVHPTLRSHRSTTGSARPAAPGRDPTASG